MDQERSRRALRNFAGASFLNDLGSDMIYPIWPAFVTGMMAANMTILGLIDGLGEAVVSISQAISGYLADRLRRRKIFVWTGYVFGSLSRIGYAFSGVWEHLVPFRILDRAGKIRAAPRDAIVADLSSDKNRGRNFGMLRTMDNLGAVCGITFCLAFVSLFGESQYRTLFLIAAVPSLIGAALILVRIKETKSADTMLYKGISLRDFDANFKLYLILSALFALGSFSYSFLLLHAQRLGFQPFALIALYLIFNVVASVFSWPFGRLSDRIGRKKVLMLSFALWGFTCLSLAAFQGLLMIISFAMYGLYKGALEPVQRAFVSEISIPEYRASTLGGFQMVIGLCALPASLLAGVLWDQISEYAPFYFSLVLTLISISMLAFVKERQNGQHDLA